MAVLLILAAGVFSTYVDVENDLVLVDTSLPSAHVQKLLEDTGKLVVFRGIGGTAGGDSIGGAHGAAVAIFRDGGVNGLARLVQTDAECCVVEGTVDGLHPGPYQLQVRQYGDLSKGCLRYDGHVLILFLQINPLFCILVVVRCSVWQEKNQLLVTLVQCRLITVAELNSVLSFRTYRYGT